MEKFKVEVTKSHEFSIEDINNLMVTALEGGINYWCRKAGIKSDKETNTFVGVSEEDQSKVELASDAIGYGGTLVLFDAESSDKWELTRDMMLKGIKMYCEDNNVDPAELMDVHDAGDADSIVQYALFDELVFG